jgi:hypothetical protein
VVNVVGQPITKTQSPNNQKRIEEIEKEIADLRAEEMGNLTEAQFLRQRLREALNNRFFPLIPTIEQGTEAIMPTQKEVSEYSDLLDKQDKTDEEQARFEELKSKLGMWRLMDSAYITDTQTVADIVELLNQLEAQIEQDEIVIDNLNDNSEIVQGSDTIYVADLMQNTNGTPTAKAIKKQDGSVVLSLRHREVANIVNPLIQSGLTGKILTTTKVEVEATPKNIKKYAKKVGTIYEIGDIKITIGENGSLEMKESDFQKAKDTINTHVFDSAEISWSYADTFMEVGDNEFIKRPSDFSNPNLSSEGSSIQNLEEGDVVNLKVYTNSPYNQELRDRILKEVEDKGEVSQETLDLIEKNLEITADNHSVLKATADKMGTTLSDNNFLLLRSILAERFVQEVVEAGAVASVPKVIDVGIKASVKEVFLGTPNLMLERTPNGLKPKEIEFSDEALKQVVTQGYVQGNQTVLADKTLEDKVKRSYIKKLAEKNPTAKIPVVVFKVGKHFVAYPISLIKSPNPQGQSLDSILATAKNSTDAAKAINSMLISYGISPSEFNLIDLDKTKLDKIRERLDALTVFTSPDKMAESTYDKNLLKADAKIKVDLANKPISSPKLRIDLDTINLGEKKDLEMKQADLRASIVKDMVEIEKLIQGSVNLSIKNQFLTAFDDVTVRNTPQDIFNRKDVNLMKSIMYRPDGTRKPVQGDALKLLGQQRVDNLRRKLEQLQLLENQTKIKPNTATQSSLTCKP